MRLQDYDTTLRFTASVVANERITADASPHEVREIVLDIDRRGFQVEVGQSIGVLAPGRAEFGQDEHLRLYSVADLPKQTEDGSVLIQICVRRCSYVDEYSGEVYPGVASNYLCDLKAMDKVTLTGPYGLAFEVPAEKDANLILIGAGTGIAPFRAFVNHIYTNHPEFEGHVWLFHGARSGLDLLYMNDKQNDFQQYYDRDTFQAISALSPRPHWTDKIDWAGAMESRAEELWKLLGDPKTHVYVAGLESIRDALDKVFAGIAGSPEKWELRKAELTAGRRWIELLY